MSPLLRTSSSMLAEASSGRAQGSSPLAQVKTAAAHVERLKRKQCEKILDLSMRVSRLLDYLVSHSSQR
jgi:hypothetical protein